MKQKKWYQSWIVRISITLLLSALYFFTQLWGVADSVGGDASQLTDNVRALVEAIKAGQWLSVLTIAGSIVTLVRRVISPNPPISEKLI